MSCIYMTLHLSTEIIVAEEGGKPEANPAEEKGGGGGEAGSEISKGDHVCFKRLNYFAVFALKQSC